MYTIEVPSLREHIFLDRLQKACYIQVKKRRVVKEPLNSEFTMKFFLRLMFFLDDYYLCKYNSYCFQICVSLLPSETNKVSGQKT